VFSPRRRACGRRRQRGIEACEYLLTGTEVCCLPGRRLPVSRVRVASESVVSHHPQLHQPFNEATKLAGASGTKGSADPAVADQLLAKIEEISKIFWETKQG
jgi:hypothetical protein